METLKKNDMVLPRLGLGTFRVQGPDCQKMVESALALGYRHIDTAAMYGNEVEVGAAIAGSGVARGDVKLTTKVWFTHLEPAAMMESFETSLAKLKMDYVDLFLIHWGGPNLHMASAMETLVKIKESGRAKAIGVANFTVAMLKEALETIQAPLSCNQVEYHVMLGQEPLYKYMRSKDLPLTAYCPLAQGKLGDIEVLAAIAKKHGCSAAQVALAWLLGQEGVAAIPKSANPANQKSNLEALNVKLDADDYAKIATLPKDKRCVSPPHAPAWDPPTA